MDLKVSAVESEQDAFDTQYVEYLVENGLLPEALHVSRELAKRCCPDIEEQCEAASRPATIVEVRYRGGARRCDVQVWEFSGRTNPWVVGSPTIGIFGIGRDIDRAAEYLSERLVRLEEIIAAGDFQQIPQDPLGEIVSWIQTQRTGDFERGQHYRLLLRESVRSYRKSNYGLAKAFLDRANAGFSVLDSRGRSELRRFAAFTSVRCGKPVAGAYGIDHLNEELRYHTISTMTCSDFLCCSRYAGLTPLPCGEQWFKRGNELARGTDSGAKALLHLYWGMTTLARGDSTSARLLLEDALAVEMDGLAETRIVALVLTGLAEVDRIQGEFERGLETLAQVRRGQEAEELWGDLADFTLPGLAKFEGDPAQARALLESAKNYAANTGNIKASLRAHLIEARTLRHEFSRSRQKQRVVRMMQFVEDVQQCALTEKIIRDWDRWTGGVASPETDYWGL